MGCLNVCRVGRGGIEREKVAKNGVLASTKYFSFFLNGVYYFFYLSG